jgi:hypothetical protein
VLSSSPPLSTHVATPRREGDTFSQPGTTAPSRRKVTGPAGTYEPVTESIVARTWTGCP